MMLTIEQIRAFDASAEAGEKPTPGLWSDELDTSDSYRIIRRVKELPGLFVRHDVEGWYVFGSPSKFTSHFSSAVAAQLAVEWLLFQVTLPLHAPKDANGKPLRIGDRVRCVCPDFPNRGELGTVVMSSQHRNSARRVVVVYDSGGNASAAPHDFERVEGEK